MYLDRSAARKHASLCAELQFATVYRTRDDKNAFVHIFGGIVDFFLSLFFWHTFHYILMTMHLNYVSMISCMYIERDFIA